ncbi:uncharacterized protein LOC103026139 [Astyanax mexicanus]|uniref:uncharacterized protein LOC103026139 n=1 Tax=Astyanax mexicanus TaxID=7994 RepID=UPI0020CB5245|nr:uncharacterized protein LOC103026139 [Astyanax mexicanus]
MRHLSDQAHPAFHTGSDDLRIVLLGNAKVGKSATANVILGRETFRETETTECELQRGRVDDRNVSIIDTPGINSATLSSEQLKTEMRRLFSLSDPGPHVFLLLIRVGNFTEDQRSTVEWIQENFGEEALKFTMLLFTGREEMTGSQWKTFSEETNVQEFTKEFGGGYAVINSKKEINSIQKTKLLEKIEEVIKQNKGQHFTDKIYKAIQKRNAEEADRHDEERTQDNINTTTGEGTQQTMATFNTVKGSEAEMKEEKAAEDEMKGKHVRKEESFRSPSKANSEKERLKQDLKRQQESRRLTEKEKWEKERASTEGHPEPGESADVMLMYTTVKRFYIIVIMIYYILLMTGLWIQFHKYEYYGLHMVLTPLECVSVSDVRIVLIGRPRSGKSATGNTILGREAFGKDLINVPNTVKVCKRQDGTVGNKSVSVVDTKLKRHNLTLLFKGYNLDLMLSDSEFVQCLQLCSPGPHVFLLVGRDLWRVLRTLDLEYKFGEEFLKRSIVLITHGDKHGKVKKEDFSWGLQHLVDRCGGGYQIFNNEEQEDRTQVTELLEKIETLIEKNEGKPYANEMYQAHRQRMQEESSSCSVL